MIWLLTDLVDAPRFGLFGDAKWHSEAAKPPDDVVSAGLTAVSKGGVGQLMLIKMVAILKLSECVCYLYAMFSPTISDILWSRPGGKRFSSRALPGSAAGL